jgi:type IV secretory pathway TraG/TraD family ATPase VirD4
MTKESTKAAMAFCFLGTWLSFLFKQPLSGWVFAALTLFLGWSYFTAVSDRRKTINVIFRILGIAFTWDDLCAHLVIIGRSGCGKTAGVLKSILTQMARNADNWGAIILDEKGDFHEMLHGIWTALGKAERLVIVRVPLPEEAAKIDLPPVRVNLIGDRTVPWATYAQLVIDVAVSQGQKTDNAFFKSQGRNIITRIFEALELVGHPVTLATAHAFVSNKDVYKQVIADLELTRNPQALELVQYWLTLDVTSAGQKDGIFSTADNYLMPYSQEIIANVFSSIEPNFTLKEIDNCKLVVPSIPQLYLFNRSYIHAFIKLWFFFDTFRRYDLPNSRQVIQTLPKRGLIIDEAQNSLLGSEEGLADHKAIDKVRGAGAFLIYAMQSYSSAKPNIQDESKVNTIFANMGTHVIHAIKDHPGRETASKMFVSYDKKKTTRSFGHNGDLSVSETTEEKPTRRPDFFLNLRKFEAIVSHVEGRTAHGYIEPVTDDGMRVEEWYRASRFNRNFDS